MEWFPTRIMSAAADKESGGDIVMTSSSAADNTHADPAKKTETVPKEAQFELEMGGRLEYDLFGHLFSGPNHTKLPAAELLRLQAHQLQRVRDLGYAPEEGGAAEEGPGFSGAACASLVAFNISPTDVWKRKFFGWASERLASAAEASRDLAAFIHALNPNITCTHTEAGWDLYFGGVIRMYCGRHLSAPTYVEFFISRAEQEWEFAEGEADRWENEEDEASWEAQAGRGRNLVGEQELL